MAHRQQKTVTAKRSRQHLSKLVFLILDQTGTNHYIKGIRQNLITNYERILDTSLPHCFSAMLTGSKAEGIVPQSVSDYDLMFAYNGILCVKDENASKENTEFLITKPDYTEAPPGYCKVAFGNEVNAGPLEDFCCIYINLVPSGCKLFISSLLTAYLLKQFRDVSNEMCAHDNMARTAPIIQGPAVTQSGCLDLSIFGLNMAPIKVEMDCVAAIYFYGIRFLQEWADRSRFHNWPSTDVIKEVSSMEGYSVPVGEKDSENATLYWRISYVTAEKKLLACFNSTLDKVYVLLKMMTKTLCSPVISKISSYMVKNVVLWVAETNPKCTEDTLIDMFLQCLNFFKLCLHNNHLPNYMIPKRNMLAGRIVCKEKINLIQFLSDLLDKGEEVVQIFPRLSQYITRISIQPEMFLCYGMWRNYVETLLSGLYKFSMEHMTADTVLKRTVIAYNIWGIVQDETCFSQGFFLVKLLEPNWVEKFMRGQLQEVIENIDRVLKEVFNIYLLD